MKVLIDPPKFDYTKFNKQIVKTETAGKLLNYYGDLVQRIELTISKESIIKKLPEMVADVPVFKNLIYNKNYTNIFNIKLNNIHKLAEEIQSGMVYLEKITMSNRSKWLKKNFKEEIKLFASTYKEITVRSYFDLKDKNCHLKYDVIFNFNGVNPNNQGKFEEINQLTTEKVDKQGVMDAIQNFIIITDTDDIQVISKAQLLDLIEEAVEGQNLVNEETVILPTFSETDVIAVGKQQYPQLNMRLTGTKNNPKPHERYFINGSKVKQGSYTESGIKNLLATNITDILVKWAKENGATDLNYARITTSVYFTLKGKAVRISDHSRPFDGISIIVKYNTDPRQALEAFKLLF